MAVVTIKPNAVIGTVAGWNVNNAGFVEAVSDGVNATAAVQNQQQCSATVGLSDDSVYTNATDISFVVSLKGNAGRSGASVVDIQVKTTSGDLITSGELEFGSSVTIESLATHPEEGSIEGGSSTIDDMVILINPNTSGITLREVSVAVTFTAAASGYGNTVNGVAPANIVQIIGIATANISKVSGV